MCDRLHWIKMLRHPREKMTEVHKLMPAVWPAYHSTKSKMSIFPKPCNFPLNYSFVNSIIHSFNYMLTLSWMENLVSEFAYLSRECEIFCFWLRKLCIYLISVTHEIWLGQFKFVLFVFELVKGWVYFSIVCLKFEF